MNHGKLSSGDKFWFSILSSCIGNKKVPVKFCILICCSVHALWTESEHYHYVVCYAFQSPADLTKSEKYASFAIMILIL